MTQKEQKNFARRFNLDDWIDLCGNLEFLDALEKTEPEAEVTAWRILTHQISRSQKLKS